MSSRERKSIIYKSFQNFKKSSESNWKIQSYIIRFYKLHILYVSIFCSFTLFMLHHSYPPLYCLSIEFWKLHILNMCKNHIFHKSFLKHWTFFEILCIRLNFFCFYENAFFISSWKRQFRIFKNVSGVC